MVRIGNNLITIISFKLNQDELAARFCMVNSKIDFKYKKIVLSLWGQNLGNSKFLIYGSGDTSFGRSVRMGSPLTWGITSGIKF